MQNTNRKPYIVQFSSYRKMWMVMNTINGVAQSAWSSRNEAAKVMATLNMAVA